MKFNHLKTWSTAALVAAACGLAAPVMANSGTVSYTCQNNKSVNVKYQFNSAGLPTTAQVVLRGAMRTLRYDMKNSNDMDTLMTDRRGYRLSASYLDSSNYRNNEGVMINAPEGEILFKDCNPARGARRAPADEPRASRDGSVTYACQNGRRLDVRYRFNSGGIPIQAVANIRGRSHVLAYNQGQSNDVDTIFTGRGYRLSAGYIDSNNFRSEGGLMVTAPNNQLLYKGCEPVR